MPGVEQIQEEAGSEAPTRWRVRPMDRSPRKIVGIIAFGVVAFAVGTFLFRNPLLGIVGFAIIFGSTAEFWLGTSYSIDKKGATVRTGFSLSAIEWADVKRILPDATGIKLSPLEKPSGLDAFRGVYLRFGSDNRERVERAVLTFGKSSANDVGGGSDGGADGISDSEGGG